MKRSVTLCLAYYENPTMLGRQLINLSKVPKDILAGLELIVVDDGSPDHPAWEVFNAHPYDLPFCYRLFRMALDVPWNQDACRNIAVEHAANPWVLLTDMDHLPTVPLLRTARFGELSPHDVYRFARVSEPHLDAYKPHPNSWLMTRAMYSQVGGYDERYAGIYGTDGMFARRVKEAARNVVELPEALIRVPRTVTADASTTRYPRKTAEDDWRKQQVSKMIERSGDPKPRRLTFPYTRVL